MREPKPAARKGHHYHRPSPDAQALADDLFQRVRTLSGVIQRPLRTNDRVRLPRIKPKPWGEVETMLLLAERTPAYAPHDSSPATLRKLQADLQSIEHVLGSVRTCESLLADSVRVLSTELYRAGLTIYRVATAQTRDRNAVTAAAAMREALKHGPRAQKSVMVPIPPLSTSKAARKKAILDAARAEAGIPPAGPPRVKPR